VQFINFLKNRKFDDGTLRKAMGNTKQKGTLFKRTKYVEED